jgi:UDP-N-acetylmuramate: L-alanyl-gamma-D-glutamyl-meso-diaminopimelate ligase
MLEKLKIPYKTPYNPENLAFEKPDLVVVANVLSRGNSELEKVIADQLPYTSFPQLLGDQFLKDRVSCVVAGTHGKTTTTALLAHALTLIGEEPGFMIGGLPKNFDRSFLLGKGQPFVIEGDEYDTAFFDKGPKFLHYHPKHLILNNIEFDHADIYKDLAAVELSFEKLISIVPHPDRIIANIDDPGVLRVLTRMGLLGKVRRCSGFGKHTDSGVVVRSLKALTQTASGMVPRWEAQIDTQAWGPLKVQSNLTGPHNFANIAQVLSCIASLDQAGHLKGKVDVPRLLEAISDFAPPKRRLDLLGELRGTLIFEDFAHHPTAVRLVIETLRLMYPQKPLTVAFEPRSATNRRNVFHDEYVHSLSLADTVLVGEALIDQRIPADLRFNPQALVKDIGPKAESFSTNGALLERLQTTIKPGGVVVFMSSGSFSGVQHQLLKTEQAS